MQHDSGTVTGSSPGWDDSFTLDQIEALVRLGASLTDGADTHPCVWYGILLDNKPLFKWAQGSKQRAWWDGVVHPTNGWSGGEMANAVLEQIAERRAWEAKHKAKKK